MQISLMDRESFLDWVGGKPSVKPVRLTATKLRQPLGKDIAVVYDDPSGSGSSKPIIAVPEDSLTDFYAFVGTYVPEYRPFSAFFKVVSFEFLAELTSLHSSATRFGGRMERLIGVSIAEVYTQSRARIRAFDRISVSAVQATLSASLTEATWQGYSPNAIEHISRRWEIARELTDSDDLFLAPKKIAEVWTVVSEVITDKTTPNSHPTHKKISSALKQAALGNSSEQDWLLPFLKEFPKLAKNVSGLSRSREERVRLVRDALPELMDSSSDILAREFLAGAIASMVGNGSYAQMSLLDDVLPKLPSAALWFGVVSSFLSGTDALTVGNCLGRRVLRDMNVDSSLFTSIADDISFEELKMFRNEGKLTHSFRTAQANSMTVSLLGNVSGRFKIGGGSNNETKRADLEAKARDAREQSQELLYLLDRARHMAGKLAHSRQKDLFDDM